MHRAPFDEQSILQQALEIESPDRRADFLSQSCAGDTQLRSRLETKIEARRCEVERQIQSGGTIDLPADFQPPESTIKPNSCTASSEPNPSPGLPSIEGFRMIRSLGKGGAGEVFEAEQIEPIRRRVAIKFIKHGMTSESMLARFDAERQMLAAMDHPNIARVLDGGTTKDGRPYFVMELISGIPITQYCRENEVPLRERLALFVQVCQAIQHAHLKGIIHRDIKPSNILVRLRDMQPDPIVIDFGVAKATQSHGQQLHTEHGQVVGTLEYMSPEQASMTGLDIDTRCDVYSLGVLLFELLTETTPLGREQFSDTAFDEILRTIRSQESPSPSSRVSNPRARRRISGELDWITSKALANQRARRYETARDLARDVNNYLTNQPVSASPPSLVYHASKFTQKHCGKLAAAAAIFTTLLAGLIATTNQSIRASKAELDARQQFHAANAAREKTDKLYRRAIQAEKDAAQKAAIATAINRFLKGDLLANADPNNEPDRNITLRVVLDRAANKVEKRLQDQPHIEAAIRETIGSTYHSLGEWQQAEKHLKHAAELFRNSYGDEDQRTLSAQVKLGRIHVDQGKLDKVTSIGLNSVWKTSSRVLGNKNPISLAALNNLALHTGRKGHRDEAINLFEKLVHAIAEHPTPNDHDLIAAMNNLAVLHQQQGQHDKAEKYFRDLVVRSRGTFGREAPKTLIVMMGLAESHRHQGEFDQAARINEEVIRIATDVLGHDHPTTIIAMNNLAMNYQSLSRFNEAIGILKSIVTIQQRNAPNHESTLVFMNNLALIYKQTGEFTQAEQLFKQCLQTQREIFGDSHPNTRIFQQNLEDLHEQLNQ